MEALIAADGKVESAHAVDGSMVLGEAASDAIQKWMFHPAQRDGKPVEDRVRINVEFRLDGEQVRAQIVWPDAPPSSTP
jgi:TonB family protein